MSVKSCLLSWCPCICCCLAPEKPPLKTTVVESRPKTVRGNPSRTQAATNGVAAQTLTPLSGTMASTGNPSPLSQGFALPSAVTQARRGGSIYTIADFQIGPNNGLAESEPLPKEVLIHVSDKQISCVKSLHDKSILIRAAVIRMGTKMKDGFFEAHILCNHALEIIAVNPNVQKKTGWQPLGMLSKRLNEFVPESAIPRITQAAATQIKFKSRSSEGVMGEIDAEIDIVSEENTMKLFRVVLPADKPLRAPVPVAFIFNPALRQAYLSAAPQANINGPFVQDLSRVSPTSPVFYCQPQNPPNAASAAPAPAMPSMSRHAFAPEYTKMAPQLPPLSRAPKQSDANITTIESPAARQASAPPRIQERPPSSFETSRFAGPSPFEASPRLGVPGPAADPNQIKLLSINE